MVLLRHRDREEQVWDKNLEMTLKSPLSVMGSLGLCPFSVKLHRKEWDGPDSACSWD